MSLVSMRQLLDHAAENGYGIPAFNVNNLEQMRAIMEAADETDSPVIVQASAGARKYAGAPFLRLDIPLPGGHSHAYFIGAQSIYGVSPMGADELTESARVANENTLAYAGLLSPAERARFDLRQAQVRAHLRLALEQPDDAARAERVRELH